MRSDWNGSPHEQSPHAGAAPPARDSCGRRIDTDCIVAIDEMLTEEEIVERCFNTAEGHAGWECGMRLAARCAGPFVTDLVETQSEHCATAAGRADVRALARSLLVPMAHQCATLQWRAAATEFGVAAAGMWSEAAHESPTDDDPRRGAFKRGMAAGFFYGMADAVSRGIDGRAMVEA